jgi:hypothetical protein
VYIYFKSSDEYDHYWQVGVLFNDWNLTESSDASPNNSP